MSLESTIQSELMAAMRSKNEAALRALRAVKSALLLAKTSGGRSDTITADEEIKLLQKLVKQRNESMEIYLKEGRAELAAAEKEEVDIIMKFLPEQMDDTAIETVLKKVIADTGASSVADTDVSSELSEPSELPQPAAASTITPRKSATTGRTNPA